ncbi:hypothetical protein KPATCC21470_0683 [Kitasatospora purpeofusca]
MPEGRCGGTGEPEAGGERDARCASAPEFLAVVRLPSAFLLLARRRSRRPARQGRPTEP